MARTLQQSLRFRKRVADTLLHRRSGLTTLFFNNGVSDWQNPRKTALARTGSGAWDENRLLLKLHWLVMRKLVGVMLGLLALVAAVQLFSGRRAPRAPAGNPSVRIVSMAPNLTSLLFRLGVGDRVVGVTSFCDYPPEVRQLPRIGDFLNPNYESIVSLEPDLVLAERWSSSKSADRLRQLGLNVHEVISPHSIAEIAQLIAEVGTIVGEQPRSRALIEEMERRIVAVRRRAEKFPFTPRVYLEIDLPTWTVGGPSFTSEALEVCGARNIFADLQRPASQVSAEAIVQRNPDVIVTFVATREQVSARPGWGQIEAVRTGRIIDEFDEALLSRANHRVVDGMEALQTALERALNMAPGPLPKASGDEG